MPHFLELDQTDLQILNHLMEDSSTSYVVLAKKLFVSSGTIHVRIKKLERLGIIKGTRMVVDTEKLGFDITAFIGVHLEKNSLYDLVAKQLGEIPEILNLHYTTGGYSMFAKIICRDTKHLREVLHDKIQKIEGIRSTETLISLEESINRNIILQPK